MLLLQGARVTAGNAVGCPKSAHITTRTACLTSLTYIMQCEVPGARRRRAVVLLEVLATCYCSLVVTAYNFWCPETMVHAQAAIG